MHLDTGGLGVEAARDFRRLGGTGFLLVTKPLSRPCRSVEDFGEGFRDTIEMARRVRERTGLGVLVAVGPHPAELPRLKSVLGMVGAKEVMFGALWLAGRLVAEGQAHALGEIGRPHFAVEEEVWRASNEVMEAAMRLARELDCALILHTESATPEVFAELAETARRAGADPERVIKHFSPPIVKVSENHGLFPSILAGKGALERALAQGTRFMLETDYLDDPARPGAVLGPATVPKRTLELFRKGALTEEQGWRIHSDNPSKVLGRGRI
ncbi:MAG: TatD family hydrolase [Thermoplasmata archaeon]